jgi:hypothetical protein
LWAVPIGAFVLAAGGLAWLGRSWVKRSQRAQAEASAGGVAAPDEALDRALEDELRRLDEP